LPRILFKLFDLADDVLGGMVETALLDDQVAKLGALLGILLLDVFDITHRKAS
jgi:hypothetical protein